MKEEQETCLLFVHEMGTDALKVDIGSGDNQKMFRLGRRE